MRRTTRAFWCSRREVNRVLDFTQNGLKRVINAVIPQVNADMLTYRRTMQWCTDPTCNRCNKADAGSADDRKICARSAGYGQRRILISEYGLFENEQPGDTWRADAVLSTARVLAVWAFL